MSWKPTATLELMQSRAVMLRVIRAFFLRRGVLEVDTPSLSNAAVSDPAIESVATHTAQQRYLHTSPELAMKRLLAAGFPDIYQVCKVFRAGEAGRYHNLEFTLLEWYRLGWNAVELQDELVTLVQELAQKPLSVNRQSYSACFQSALGIDPLEVSVADLEKLAASKGVNPDCDLLRDSWLDLLFSTAVVDQFLVDQLTVVYDYPASQAALARLNPDGKTAARFEVFWGSTELANGYHELTSPDEQRQRFTQDLVIRKESGLAEVPLDQNFLAAVDAGLPDCAGVALGLDRLLMKLTSMDHIDQVIAFPVNRA